MSTTAKFHRLRSTMPRMTSSPSQPKITPLAPTTR